MYGPSINAKNCGDFWRRQLHCETCKVVNLDRRADLDREVDVESILGMVQTRVTLSLFPNIAGKLVKLH